MPVELCISLVSTVARHSEQKSFSNRSVLGCVTG